MQAVRRRVDTHIGGGHLFHQLFFSSRHDVLEHASPTQFFNEIFSHRFNVISKAGAKVHKKNDICKFYCDFLKFAAVWSLSPGERKKKKKRTKRIISPSAFIRSFPGHGPVMVVCYHPPYHHGIIFRERPGNNTISISTQQEQVTSATCSPLSWYFVPWSLYLTS